jgi:hypothetical protein
VSKRPKHKNRIYLQLAELRAEEAELVPIVEALPEVQRLKALKAAIAALEEYAAATRQRTRALKVSTADKGPFTKLSLPDAAMKQLELAGKPQSAEEIWAALSAGGVVITAKNPVHAVHWSLRRRARKGANVQSVNKKWSLKPPKKGGMANRDRDAHIERTKAGIANFKTRTGISWGRKRTVTAEHIAKFREAFDKGAPVSQAAKHAGISNAYFYGNREAILSWNPGMPWPMPLGVSGDELRAMGIIPMHAKVVGEE